MDIVIVDPIRTNMVRRTFTMTTHATTMVAQEKTQFYIELALGDDFIPLVIHFRFDSFLIAYA
jgi:hypothetical protein